jgi:hypothetical protein
MSIRDNFTGFWNLWKHGIVERNYPLLDEIHPNRIRSAEEWFREKSSWDKNWARAACGKGFSQRTRLRFSRSARI